MSGVEVSSLGKNSSIKAFRRIIPKFSESSFFRIISTLKPETNILGQLDDTLQDYQQKYLLFVIFDKFQ